MHASTQAFIHQLKEMFLHRLPNLMVSRTGRWNAQGCHVNEDLLKLDACVSLDENAEPRITFSAGFLLAMVDVSSTLAATKSYIPEIPLDERQVEHVSVPAEHNFVNYRYLNTNTPFGEGAKFFMPLRSSQTSRIELGEFLCDLLMRVVSSHEYGHFANGHLFYTCGPTLGASYHEMQDGGDGPDKAAIRRALELDADTFAAAAMMDLLRSADLEATISSFACEFARSVQGFIRLLFSCFAILFALLSLGEGSTSDFTSKRLHPTPIARLTWFFYVLVLYHIHKTGGKPGDELYQSLEQDVNTIGRVLDMPLPGELVLGLVPGSQGFDELSETLKVLRGIHEGLWLASDEASSLFGGTISKFQSEKSQFVFQARLYENARMDWSERMEIDPKKGNGRR